MTSQHYCSYYLLRCLNQAQNEAIRAARQFQTANGNYRAAKEMITLAEQGVDNSSSTCSLSTAWQETLNHATVRVSELIPSNDCRHSSFTAPGVPVLIR